MGVIVKILIDQMADFFEFHDLGEKDIDIHPGQTPNEPDNIIVIRSTAGQSPHLEAPLSYPSFQIFVRANMEPDVIEKSWKVYQLLNRGHHLKLIKKGEGGDEGRIVLRYCYAETPPLRVGEDENRRIMYTINFNSSIDENTIFTEEE